MIKRYNDLTHRRQSRNSPVNTVTKLLRSQNSDSPVGLTETMGSNHRPEGIDRPPMSTGLPSVSQSLLGTGDG